MKFKMLTEGKRKAKRKRKRSMRRKSEIKSKKKRKRKRRKRKKSADLFLQNFLSLKSQLQWNSNLKISRTKMKNPLRLFLKAWQGKLLDFTLAVFHLFDPMKLFFSDPTLGKVTDPTVYMESSSKYDRPHSSASGIDK